jgi:hypothetical protein
VVHPVEKLLQVDIHDPTIPLRDDLLRSGDGLVRVPVGAKAVAVLGERRVPPLLKHLQDGLLHQPVQHGRNSQLPHPASRFGNLDPLGRPGLVTPLKQLGPNLRPVVTEVAGQLLDGHPVDARSTLVLTDSLERSLQIPWVTNLLH